MKAARKVLVIDDERAIRRLLKASLEPAGYSVIEAGNAEDGLREAASQSPLLILLDLGLPDMDGREVLRRLRQWSQAPVLVLTVQDAEEDKVALLDAGADDYLCKPFSVPELLARLRVLERHRRGPQGQAVVEAGELAVDLGGHVVRRKGEEVKLTAKEFEFLAVLARAPGKVVTQKQILNEVWGPHSTERSHYLRIYAAQLRRKLEDDPSNPRWIITEPGVGYRLRA